MKVTGLNGASIYDTSNNEIKIKLQEKEQIEKKDNSKLFEKDKTNTNLLVNNNDLEELENISELNTSKVEYLLEKIDIKDNNLNKFNTKLNFDTKGLFANNMSLDNYISFTGNSIDENSFNDIKEIEFKDFTNEFVAKYLEENNLERHDILGDGNCFFHSISKGLSNLDEPINIDYKKLRENACKYIENNKNKFIGVDNDYLNDMKKDKTFADNEVVRALSKSLNRPIVMVNTRYDNKALESNLETFVFNHSSKDEPIFILRKNENHFELLTHNDKNSNDYKLLLENVRNSSDNDFIYEEALPKDEIEEILLPKEDLSNINKFIDNLKNKEPREQLDSIIKKIKVSELPGELGVLNQKKEELINKYFSNFDNGISKDNIKSLIANFKEVTAHKGIFKTDRLVKPIYNSLGNLEKALNTGNIDNKINALAKINKEINNFLKSNAATSTRTEWVRVLQNTINNEINNISGNIFEKNIDVIKNIKDGDKISVKDNNFILQKSSISQGITRSKNNDKRDDLKIPLEKLMTKLKNDLDNNKITIPEYISIYKGLENLSNSYNNKFTPLKEILNTYRIENNTNLINNLEQRVNTLKDKLTLPFSEYEKIYNSLKTDLSTFYLDNLLAKIDILEPKKVKYLPVHNNIEIDNNDIKVKNKFSFDNNYNDLLEKSYKEYMDSGASDFVRNKENTCEIFKKDFDREKNWGYTFEPSNNKEKIFMNSMEIFSKSFDNDPDLIYFISKIISQAFFGNIAHLSINNKDEAYIKTISDLNIMPINPKKTYNFTKIDNENYNLNINSFINKEVSSEKSILSIVDMKNNDFKTLIDLDINLTQNINIKISKNNNLWGFKIEDNTIEYEISNFFNLENEY